MKKTEVQGGGGAAVPLHGLGTPAVISSWGLQSARLPCRSQMWRFRDCKDADDKDTERRTRSLRLLTHVGGQAGCAKCCPESKSQRSRAECLQALGPPWCAATAPPDRPSTGLGPGDVQADSPDGAGGSLSVASRVPGLPHRGCRDRSPVHMNTVALLASGTAPHGAKCLGGTTPTS